MNALWVRPFEKDMLYRGLTAGHVDKNSTTTNARPSSFATEPILQEFMVRVRVVRNFIPRFNTAVAINRHTRDPTHCNTSTALRCTFGCLCYGQLINNLNGFQEYGFLNSFFDLITVSVVVKIANIESEEYLSASFSSASSSFPSSSSAFAWNNDKGSFKQSRTTPILPVELASKRPKSFDEKLALSRRRASTSLVNLLQTKHKHRLPTFWFGLWVSYYLQRFVHTHKRLYGRSIDLNWR